MEINFNSSRPTDPANNHPVKPQAPVAAQEPARFEAAQSLERSVKDLPAVRPEQVERARTLIADVKYPPQEMLDRIANLLALHLK